MSEEVPSSSEIPRSNRDIELEKLRLYWDYNRSFLNSVLVLIFSGMVAAATILNTQAASSVIHLNIFYEDAALLLFTAVVVYYLSGLQRMLNRLVRRTDVLLKELQAGHSIPDLAELCEAEPHPVRRRRLIVVMILLIIVAVLFFLVGLGVL